jgi:hypothetical protein
MGQIKQVHKDPDSLRAPDESRDLPPDMKPSVWVKQVMRQARAETRAANAAKKAAAAKKKKKSTTR